MKKYQIVKEKKDFDNILHTGKYIKNKYFVIYYKESKNNFPRFGIAVGKKVGNAVIRNKLKRRYRIILTKNKNKFSNFKDYIIIVRESSLNLEFDKLEEELINVIDKRR